MFTDSHNVCRNRTSFPAPGRTRIEFYDSDTIGLWQQRGEKIITASHLDFSPHVYDNLKKGTLRYESMDKIRNPKDWRVVAYESRRPDSEVPEPKPMLRIHHYPENSQMWDIAVVFALEYPFRVPECTFVITMFDNNQFVRFVH